MSIQPRPPIVVILGHVDHGKTTLLDSIRQTNVTSGEAGGITQSIGASVVTTKEGKDITFIDTPGHAAFSQMRIRGAKLADIAVLVVAGDDGIKPQTKEALEYIKNTGNSLIVAITKTDLPASNTQSVLSQLENEGLLFEKRGGDTPYIEISAKAKTGIEELLETILLINEIDETSADPQANLSAAVIEASKEKSGYEVSIVVKNGTVKKQSLVYNEGQEIKVRALIDWTGKQINEVGPGYPVRVLGFKFLPEVGSIVADDPQESGVQTATVEKDARKTSESKKIIIKASNAGILEAVIAGVPNELTVIESGVGEVTDNDVFMAKTSGARIFTMALKPGNSISTLAKNEKVVIENYDVIYKLFEALDEYLKEGEAVIKGQAQVQATFPFSGKIVAGCKITSGVIQVGDKIQVKSGEKLIGESKAVSLRRGKEEVKEVKAGEEFGMLLRPQLELESGYDILSVIN